MKTIAAAEILLLLCGAASLTIGADILAFFPFPGVSHHKVFWPLLRQLALRGHNVTMISPFSMADPPANYREIKVPDYTEECRDLEVPPTVGSQTKWDTLTNLWKDPNLYLMREMGQFHTEKILKEPVVQWLIASDSKFDIIIGEFTFVEECYAALIHRFKASYIEFETFGNYHWSHWLYGTPIDTSYIADAVLPYSDSMNFVERFHNTVYSSMYRLFWFYYYLPMQQALADKYIRYPGWEKRPSIADSLSEKTSLLLTNTHYGLNYPYPLPPHAKEIGGINIQSQQGQLPKEIQEFMDGAEHGVIYFSMGSYLKGSSTFSLSIRDEFIQVFSGLKQRIIWKWEADIPNLPSNVMIRKWLPQSSILAHEKCRLFISHCGFLSLSEAIDSGVPIIAIPVFVDQPRNAKVVSHKGLGITLNSNNLTKQSISWAIDEIINNPSYRDKMHQQSMIFRDKPLNALNTAVYWTEYVIRHKGAPHLRPAIATMPWYQQAMLDVYFALAALVLIPLFIMYKSLRCLCKLICRRSRSTKPVKKHKSQ